MEAYIKWKVLVPAQDLVEPFDCLSYAVSIVNL